MAYIRTEQVAEMRKKIKEKFPAKKGWNFSIRKEHHSSINVSILKAPINFGLHHNKGYTLHYSSIEKYPELMEIHNIINEGNHDNSDIMIDYFDVGWYANIEIGRWDIEFEYTGEEKNLVFENDYCKIFEHNSCYVRYDKITETTIEMYSYFSHKEQLILHKTICPECHRRYEQKATGNMTSFKYLCGCGNTWGENENYNK